MQERSQQETAIAHPVATPMLELPLPLESSDELASRLDQYVLDGVANASAITENINGGINRGIAAANTQKAIISNAIQLPITLAANDASKLYAQISGDILGNLSRQVGEAVEFQSTAFPGVANLAQAAYSDAERQQRDDATAQLSQQYQIRIDDAARVVATFSTELVAAYLYDPVDPEIRHAVTDAIRASGVTGTASGTAVNVSPQATSPATATATAQAGASVAGVLPKLCEWGVAAYAGFRFSSTDCIQSPLTVAEYNGFRSSVETGTLRGWVRLWQIVNGNGMQSFVRGVGLASGTSMPPVIDPPNALFDGGAFAVFGESPTIPAPPPSTIPPTPPTPIPPRPPLPTTPQQPACIPICNPFAPPTCPPPEEPKDCEEPDLCEECKASLWFNPDDCTFKIFIEGCGPPRTERQWIEVGTTTDKDKVQALLDEHCKDDDDSESSPGVPGIPPRGGQVLTPVQLCNFLPPAGMYASFSTPGVIATSLHVLANGIRAVPNLGWLAGVVSAIANAASAQSDMIGGWVKSIFDAVLASSGCNDGRTTGLYLAVAAIGAIERWICTGLGDLQQPFIQQARYACPTGIPSASDATAAVLADTMDMDEWECLIRANNFKRDQYIKVAEAMRRKLEPVQLIILRARNLITDAEYDAKMRQLGFTRPEDRQATWDASLWLPGPSDLVRFMQRDTADNTLPVWKTSDPIFNAKFAGKLKEWAEGQRVPPEVMMHFWRAHWSIPSPTQLFEFYRRLKHKPQFWPSGDPDKDLREALIQQDILPAWHDAFIAVTYHPLGRIDTKRLLVQGTIDETAAKEAWEELGYSPENASRLADLAERDARKQAVKHSVTKRLAAGEITEAEATDILDAESVPQRFHRLIFQRAVIEANAYRRKRCISGVRKRYMTGQLDANGLPQALMSAGVPMVAAQTMADAIVCERSSHAKEIAASQLQTWYIDGVITAAEMTTRLMRLGYSQDDAALVLRHANLVYGRKIANAEKRALAEQRAEQRRLEADQRRDEAEQRRIRNEQEADLEKQRRDERRAAAAIAAAERMLAQKRREEESVRDALAALYADSSVRFGVTLDVAVAETDSSFVNLFAVGLSTTNEVLSALAESLKTPQAIDFLTWRDAAAAILSSRIAVAQFPQT